MKEFIYKHYCFIVSIVVGIFAYICSFCFISDFVFDISKLLNTIIICLIVGIVECVAYRRGITGVLNYIKNNIDKNK